MNRQATRDQVVTALRAAGCVFAEDEARLLLAAARDEAELGDLVRRRAGGEPLEHVLGWVEFCGLRIAVDHGVFVPRRRSEFLVRQAVRAGRRLAERPAGPRGAGPAWVVIADVCCGSGALGVAVAAALGGAELHAADLDPAAVACARRNVRVAGGQVYAGDLYQALPAGLRGRVDILLAQVPYVPTAEIDLLPAEARQHEPKMALDGGTDGLDLLRRLASGAVDWLAPGGRLLTETSERQAGLAADIVRANGLTARLTRSEPMDATVIAGTRVR